jgi:hypothetical protein
MARPFGASEKHSDSTSGATSARRAAAALGGDDRTETVECEFEGMSAPGPTRANGVMPQRPPREGGPRRSQR